MSNATAAAAPPDATKHGFLARSVPFEEWQNSQPAFIPAEVEDGIGAGEDVVVYHSQGHLFGEVLRGPRYDAIEALFGRSYAVYDIRVDDVVIRCNTRVAVRRATFDTAWHVYNDEGCIIAGGPRITRERAEELAAAKGGTVRQG